MKHQVEKTVVQIKTQIEFWFLKYLQKTRTDFTGTETFTLFDLLEKTTQNTLIKQLDLKPIEVPVLAFRTSEEKWIINTTHQFVRIENNLIERVDYNDFAHHNGYKSLLVKRLSDGKPISIKTNGYFHDFGLTKTNGDIINWKIPTGTSGFAFWNVTKKCALIGRKYNIIE